MGFENVGKDYDDEIDQLKRQLKDLKDIKDSTTELTESVSEDKQSNTSVDVSINTERNDSNKEIANLKKKIVDLEHNNNQPQHSIKVEIKNVGGEMPQPLPANEIKTITATAKDITDEKEESASEKTRVEKKTTKSSTKNTAKKTTKKKAKKTKKKKAKKTAKKSSVDDEKITDLNKNIQRLESAIEKLVILFGKATDEIAKNSDDELFDKIDYIIEQNDKILDKIDSSSSSSHTTHHHNHPKKGGKESCSDGEEEHNNNEKKENPGYLQEVKPRKRPRIDLLTKVSAKKENLMPFDNMDTDDSLKKHPEVNPSGSPFVSKPILPPGFDYDEDTDPIKTNKAPPPPSKKPSIEKLDTKDQQYDT